MATKNKQKKLGLNICRFNRSVGKNMRKNNDYKSMRPIPYTLLIYYLYIFFSLSKKIQTKNNAAIHTYQVYINWKNKFFINDKDILREI